MEQYSKEFWQTCLTLPTGALSNTVAQAIFDQSEFIRKWLGGESLEWSKQSNVWEPVPKEHHRFMHHYKYRVALPKPTERDVVVFYRDSYKVGTIVAPAGIDVAVLATPEQASVSKYARTIPMLAEKYSGFKLLSITRVVIDPTNHNLLEYTTKLDNLGRVPF